MLPFARLALAYTNLILAAAPGPQGPAAGAPQAEAVEAAEALEVAFEHASAGRYRRARGAYERIARRWPDTPGGREALRRVSGNVLFSWADVLRHGPSSRRVDVVVLGDGYVFDQQDAFDDAAGDLPRIFERSPVFGEYLSYFNFVRGNVVSAEAGVDGYGRQVSTALGGRAIDYANNANVTVDPVRVHAILREIPGSEELAIAIVKRGRAGTGGDGIATIGGRHFQTLLHEWGHAFADLGDEYATDLGFRHQVTATRVNVSLTEDEEQVPWAHWIAAGTPGIGTYEGAAGQVRDVWRPKASGCIMNDGELFFCEPCREAIVLAIHDRVDPIEAFRVEGLPELDPAEVLDVTEPIRVEALLMQPAGHDLRAAWWILPAAEAPVVREETWPRSLRGPLMEVSAEPVQTTKRTKSGLVSLRVNPRDLEPGRYLVLLRAEDTARPRGERRTWVLKDDRELLRSERGLWIEVE